MYLQIKYAKLLNLEKFSQTTDNTFNFRCPICGDSEKHPNKKRGYLYPDQNGTKLRFHCHNTGKSMTFEGFLKELNPSLFNDFLFEKLGRKPAEHKYIPPTIVDVPEKSISLPSLSKLPSDHIAVRYVTARKIPEVCWNRIFYTESFRDWASDVFDEKYKKLVADQRIVFPYYNERGILVGAQGRSLESNASEIKYVSARYPGYKNLVFGVDAWDKYKETFVVEGAFDSLYLPNSLAVCTHTLFLAKKRLPSLNLNMTIFVGDNEPRNPDIVKSLGHCVQKGCNVFIWPESIDAKDLNEFYQESGESPVEMIRENTYRGLSAELKLSQWRKC